MDEMFYVFLGLHVLELVLIMIIFYILYKRSTYNRGQMKDKDFKYFNTIKGQDDDEFLYKMRGVPMTVRQWREFNKKHNSPQYDEPYEDHLTEKARERKLVHSL